MNIPSNILHAATQYEQTNKLLFERKCTKLINIFQKVFLKKIHEVAVIFFLPSSRGNIDELDTIVLN